MSKFYLVDTENVSTAWMNILDQLSEDDRIILFATDLSGKLSYREVEKYIAYKDKVKVIYCDRKSKNALDFQLVSYLGYLLRMDDKNEYIIVSRDNGFSVMESFWKSFDREVKTMHVHSNHNMENQPLVQDESLNQFIEMKVVQVKEEEPAQPEVKPKKAKKKAKKKTEVKAEEPKTEEVKKEEVLSVIEPVIEESKRPEIAAGYLNEGVINEDVTNSCAILNRHSKNKLAVIYREFVQKFGQAKGQSLYRAIKPHLNEYYSMK